jgi:hypothetical protein
MLAVLAGAALAILHAHERHASAASPGATAPGGVVSCAELAAHR